MFGRYASEKSSLEADLQHAHQSNGEAAAAADTYGLSAFKQLENEKADAHGQLVLAERERQQAEDDLQVRHCCLIVVHVLLLLLLLPTNIILLLRHLPLLDDASPVACSAAANLALAMLRP